MLVPPHLHRRLQEILGADAADDLVSLIDSMDASRGDVGELRHEMQLGFARADARFQQIDARFQQIEARIDAGFLQSNTMFEGLIKTGQAQMEKLMEKGLREQTRFFFLAWSVLLAAIVGLYAR